MKKIEMTEPAVLPAEPKIKPVPKRETPKPKPRKDDPWTVPAPKVNPTPKAITTTVMNKGKYINGKMVINDKAEMELVMSMVTKKAFDDKFVLSIGLTTELLANNAMAYAAFTDVSPVYMAKN